ncbi:MAG: NADH-quinone oxidoreductase subunit M [Anaerolineae bacterium]|nr:NADH-quinone oxidoreductase subunit M [Anaerolineae bacterium]
METFSGILTGIVIAPIIGAIVILLLNKESKEQARIIAATTMGVVLLMALFVFFGYDTDAANARAEEYAAYETAVNDAEESGGEIAVADLVDPYFAFEDKVWWVEDLGISWHLGVDGISAPMVLLASLAGFAGVLISWGIDDRTREFMAFFLLLVAGVLGVFVAVDLFVLFFFYELAIFPMYFLIVIWGWAKTRQYSAMKLTLYILIGSVLAMLGILVLYFKAGPVLMDAGITEHYSFDFVDLHKAAQLGVFDQEFSGVWKGATTAQIWFPVVFIGFGVLAGVWPFHNWSPDGHVAAPTAVSMIHAGVLMKLGAFAALRAGVQLMPSGAKVHLPWIIFLTLINVVYGALIAMRQRDFKYVIGFSSVSHMGLVSMGFATMNITGMTGAGLQMFSHGIMTALFFACVGMVYDRAHTRDIPSLGGFVTKLPLVALAFIVGGFVSMGMPGLSGFVAEFPIFVGLWDQPNFSPPDGFLFSTFNYYPIIAIFAVLGIVITAAYVLRVVGQVFFGEFNEKLYPDVPPIKIYDKVALLLLLFWMIALGVYPRLMAPMIESGMKPIVSILGG